MKVYNTGVREIHELSIKSHEYVLKQCQEIEALYNDLELIVNHRAGMEYEIIFNDKVTHKCIHIYGYNIPGKVKNYLKGLIDAKTTYLNY